MRRQNRTMRITARGQVSIPKALREAAGLLPHTEIELVVEHDGVRIVRAGQSRRPTPGQEAVRRLRESAARVPMSTDEIMALTREAE